MMFLKLLQQLFLKKINVISKEEYDKFIEKSREIIKEDIKDIPYVACYFALKCDVIWTNDADFAGKTELKIISTKELLDLL